MLDTPAYSWFNYIAILLIYHQNSNGTSIVLTPPVTMRRTKVSNDIFDALSNYVKTRSVVSPGNAHLSKFNMFPVDKQKFVE